MGDSLVRGFGYFGPSVDSVPLGGNVVASAHSSISAPILSMSGMEIRAYAFVDAGNLANSDSRKFFFSFFVLFLNF